MSPDWIDTLIQIPIVAALIYLVLALEDKRQKSEQSREEAHQRLVESLLGVIDELAARSSPDKLNSRQLTMIQDYLRNERSKTDD